MPNQLVRDLVSELPWVMRNSVEGYVDAVAAALPDIEREAGLRLPRAKADEFLFMVAVRRIWAAVNSQYWIINDSVSIAGSRGLEGFQAGRDSYAPGSKADIGRDDDRFAAPRLGPAMTAGGIAWLRRGEVISGFGRLVLEIYVDADGCPVKDEVYRVAGRYQLQVWVVANAWLRVPDSPLVSRVAVGEGLDRADDWIAERIGPGDIAITADVPLADRCVKRGAQAVTPNGRRLTETSIGEALATRNLMTGLRETGEVRGGGRPFTRQDRSRFLGALDAAIQAIRRTQKA